MTAFLCSFLAAAGLSFGSVMCFATSFDINASALRVLAVCAVCSAAFSGAFRLKRPLAGLIPVLAAALLAAVWRRQELYEGLALCLESVTDIYAQAFDWGARLSLAESLPESAAATDILALAGGFMAFVTAETVSNRRGLLLAAALSFLPVLSGFLVLQTEPQTWAILLYTGALALLILSQKMRRLGERSGARAYLALCVPLAAVIVILSIFAGPEKFERRPWADSALESMQQLGERLKNGGAQELVLSVIPRKTLGRYAWDDDPDGVQLDTLSPRSQTHREVMEVTAPESGTYYLRGYSLGEYTGSGWSAVDERAYSSSDVGDGGWPYLARSPGQMMEISTRGVSGICYLPYAPSVLPAGASPYYDAYAENGGGLTDYMLSFSDAVWPGSAEYEAFVRETYTAVPDETRTALEPMVSEITLPFSLRSVYPQASVDEAALAVGEYVRSSAHYDLNTPRQPSGTGDFAAWFLTQSDTGYCVHFATAAAVLLRCMGVPARYTVGYLVQAQAGERTVVTEDDAHAWVEYYVADEGWKILDPTPAAQDAESGPEPSAAPETAAPENTPEPTHFRPPVQGSTNTPDTGADGDGAAADGEKRAFPWALLLIPAVPAALAARRKLLRERRRREAARGTVNERALAVWREIKRLSRLLKRPAPEKMLTLAEKARFSGRALTDEELEALKACAAQLESELLSPLPGAVRLIYRVIFAL